MSTKENDTYFERMVEDIHDMQKGLDDDLEQLQELVSGIRVTRARLKELREELRSIKQL